MEYQHTPVLLAEAINLLKPQPGGRFIDGTLGGGGYTIAIAEAVGPSGLVVSFDLDPLAINSVQAKIQKNDHYNIKIVHENFRNIKSAINNLAGTIGYEKFNGIVLDLGLSSAQLEDQDRGISFKWPEAPLAMKFEGQIDGQPWPDADRIINQKSEKEIEKILRDFGEENYARKIAHNIVENRKIQPISTVGELVRIIQESIPAAARSKGKIHPATKTFQALRMAANQELDNLSQVFSQIFDLLAPEGRIVVVSYHSLEDRMVKNFFRQESKECLCPPQIPVCRCGHQARLRILTKKAVVPGILEAQSNPRSRSAKLRAAQMI